MKNKFEAAGIEVQNKRINLENRKGCVFVPTTTSLLIGESIRINPGECVADIGTGNGIFAILAKKLGANAVDAVDISEESVELALANAALNHVSINAVLADYCLPGVLGAKLYDVIIIDLPQLPKEVQRRTHWLIDSSNAGNDGTKISAVALKNSLGYLAKGGRIYFLVHSFSNPKKLDKVISRLGFKKRIAGISDIPFNLQMQTLLPWLRKEAKIGRALIFFKGNMHYWRARVYELRI